MATEVELDSSEQAVLERLNDQYVAAFMNADVEWYRQHLADDFVCIESDGSLLNKDQFLLNTAKGPDVHDYKLHDVDVRIYRKRGSGAGHWLMGRERQCQGHQSLHGCLCEIRR